MRLRKKPGLQDAIEEYRDIVLSEQTAKVALKNFPNIELELGCGRGSFVTGMAAMRPEKVLVGVESQLDIAYYAARCVRAAGCGNVRIIRANAEQVENWFAPGQVGCIYINFCDPWPKDRHAKRRLTGRRFLAKYRQIITAGGSLRFKTDNKDLFLFSLAEFAACGLEIKQESRDLHTSGIDNPVWTEYEKKFNTLGLPIYFCEAIFTA